MKIFRLSNNLLDGRSIVAAGCCCNCNTCTCTCCWTGGTEEVEEAA